MRAKLVIVSTLMILPLCLSALIGCSGSDNPTLATVNRYEIKKSEFERLYPPNAPQMASAQAEYDQRHMVLDSLIVTRLLIQAAYENGIDKSQELARAVLDNREKFLISTLYNNEIIGKSKPSEAEIRDFFNHLDYKINVKQIIVDNEDTAKMVFERLNSGEPFEKLAVAYSIAPTAKRDQGNLGFITWGSLPDEAQKAAWSMEVGETSPPIKTYIGWYIIRVTDRTPNNEERSYDELKESLRQMITGRNSHRRTFEYLESLKKQFDIKVDTATCNYLMHKRQTMYPEQLLKTLPRNDFDLEQLDRNEKELPIATWNGGHMTVMQYLTQAAVYPPRVKPDLDDYDSLAAMIFQLKRDEILILEAHNKGIDSDPEFVENLRLFRELTMAELMKKDSLPKPLPPDDAEMREYYDSHLEQFSKPTQAKVWEILVSDELKATQLKKSIKSLNEFKQKAYELSERPGKRAAYGDLGYVARTFYPNVYDAAVNTPVGRIGGPVVSMGKYSIFWVEDKIDPQVSDFLGVKRNIYEILSQQRTQAIFDDWVAKRKEQSTIEVNDDALWSTIDMSRYETADTAENNG